MMRHRTLVGKRAWTVVTGFALLASLVALPSATEAAYPGQNGKIAFWSGDVFTSEADIYSMNADGSALTRLTTAAGSDQDPAWSPDGTKIAFVSKRGTTDDDIWVMNADGSGQTQLTDDPGSDQSPTWSPDGTKIAFGRAPLAPGGGYLKRDIHVMNPDGTGEVSITNDPRDEGLPAWSPSGAKIAYQRDDTPPGCDQFSCLQVNIVTMNPDGSGQQVLRPGTGPVDWSPDAQRLLGWGYVMNADGSNLTSAPGAGFAPSWSPDGQRIVSTMDEEIYTANLDGTDSVRLTNNDPSVRDSEADWQPIPINGYPRPKGATPVHAPLVPAFAPCTAPNRTHGPPLAYDSCGPTASPQSWPANSPHISVGSPDHNNAPANSVSFMRLAVKVGNPAIPADEADVNLQVRVTDVRCIHTSPVPTCGDINTADGPDYTGELNAKLDLRLTDKDNTPHPGGPGAGTVQDFGLSLSVACAETLGWEGGAIGGTCALTTSADALIPDLVKEGKRAIWQLDEIHVLDGGADGDVDTAADNTLFMKQGVFVP